MKKSIIISAIALCFSVGSVQATPEISGSTLKLEAFYQVNSFCVSIASDKMMTALKYARLHGAKNTESLILQAIADAKAKKRK